jgi:hypothetical protein
MYRVRRYALVYAPKLYALTLFTPPMYVRPCTLIGNETCLSMDVRPYKYDHDIHLRLLYAHASIVT